MSQKEKPTVISTFAGTGGSSLGYKMAGFEELLAVEWDDHAAECFRANFPTVKLYHGDIAKLSVEQCLELAGIKSGELDCFDGSPPCQGFSTAGKRKFMDPRNSLFKEYVRLLNGLQPKTFVMENVTGMVKGPMKQIYLQIVADLRACGYRVKGEVLNAMYYGVPQSRERVIIVGVRNDLDTEPSHPKPNSKPIAVGTIKQIATPRINHSDRVAKIWSQLRIGMSADELDAKGNGFGLHKVDPSKPCPTITKGWTAGTGLLHWAECRFLSTPEIAQASSFPPPFIFPGTPDEHIKRIGNCVPPLLMRAVATHIRTAILKS